MEYYIKENNNVYKRKISNRVYEFKRYCKIWIVRIKWIIIFVYEWFSILVDEVCYENELYFRLKRSDWLFFIIYWYLLWECFIR